MKTFRFVLGSIALAAIIGVVAPAHAADDSVVVAGLQFIPSGYLSPAPLIGGTAVEVAPAIPAVKRGNRIVWTNLDPLPHRVGCVSAPSACFSLRPEMPIASPGATSTLQTTTTMPLGKYVYRCVIHTGMGGAFTLVA